ncbi:MAG: prefoldin subunit beta [Candidatus Pacearchaeota archaeon]
MTTEKKISQETAKKIQELQISEQSLQNILLQRQAFLLELNETNLALEELKTSDKDVYKIIGQIMFKTSKDELEKDLKSKKEILELRNKNLEKQETILRNKISKLRDEILADTK